MSDRCDVRYFDTLTIRLVSRLDQIHFKVYAAADVWPLKTKHFQDLIVLKPTNDELRQASRWCQTHDHSVGFVQGLLIPLLGELGLDDRG